jgi:hypothetical protein
MREIVYKSVPMSLKDKIVKQSRGGDGHTFLAL